MKKEEQLNLYEVVISVTAGDESQVIKDYFVAPDFSTVYKKLEKEKLIERTGVSELVSIAKVVHGLEIL